MSDKPQYGQVSFLHFELAGTSHGEVKLTWVSIYRATNKEAPLKAIMVASRNTLSSHTASLVSFVTYESTLATKEAVRPFVDRPLSLLSIFLLYSLDASVASWTSSPEERVAHRRPFRSQRATVNPSTVSRAATLSKATPSKATRNRATLSKAVMVRSS